MIKRPKERLFTKAYLLNRLGRGRSWLSQEIRAGRFPPPKRTEDGTLGWPEKQVTKWITQHPGLGQEGPALMAYGVEPVRVTLPRRIAMEDLAAIMGVNRRTVSRRQYQLRLRMSGRCLRMTDLITKWPETVLPLVRAFAVDRSSAETDAESRQNAADPILT